MTRQTFSDFFSEPKQPQAANIWKRIAAYLIDHGLVVLVIIILAIPMAMFDQGGNQPSPVFITVMVVVLTVTVAYLFLKDGCQGQGIGKRLMHLKVIRLDTKEPIGYGRSSLRYLFLRLLNFVELVVILVHPNHRGIGDWMANSMVINQNEK